MTSPVRPSFVDVEQRGLITILWLNDVARRNALSVGLVTELFANLRSTRVAGSRGVVIASRAKAFCAGADLKDMLASGWLDAVAEGGDLTPPDLFEAIEADPRPILAAVDALALGGGVELCLACDVVVAGPSASFAFPELGLGVLPNTALARLPEKVGGRAAAELIYTRRRIDAAEALRIGLVSRLVGVGGVVDAAVQVAEEIVTGTPPQAFAAAKRRLCRGPAWTEIRATLADMAPAEWREGTTAFVEKRKPNYEQFWIERDD
jgi:enoyl-CoA hydratase/carnithine racemase